MYMHVNQCNLPSFNNYLSFWEQCRLAHTIEWQLNRHDIENQLVKCLENIKDKSQDNLHNKMRFFFFFSFMTSALYEDDYFPGKKEKNTDFSPYARMY